MGRGVERVGGALGASQNRSIARRQSIGQRQLVGSIEKSPSPGPRDMHPSKGRRTNLMRNGGFGVCRFGSSRVSKNDAERLPSRPASDDDEKRRGGFVPALGHEFVRPRRHSPGRAGVHHNHHGACDGNLSAAGTAGSISMHQYLISSPHDAPLLTRDRHFIRRRRRLRNRLKKAGAARGVQWAGAVRSIDLID